MDQIGYVQVINGQPVIKTLAERRAELGGAARKIPTPAQIAAMGLLPLYGADRPATALGEKAVKDETPVLVDGVWVLGWSVETLPATVTMVKMEAERRILTILPEWKQRNLTARAAELAAKGMPAWTPEEQAEWDAGAALWEQIKSIRMTSDAIEAMVPIPHDYADDKWWV